MKKITLEGVIKSIIGLAGIFIVGLIVYNYSTLVLYLVIAIILSYILDPIVNWLQRSGINRLPAIAMTMISIILIILYLVKSVFPIVGDQMVKLASQLDIKSLENIAIKIEDKISNSYDFIPIDLVTEKVTAGLQDLLNFGKFSDVVSNIFSIFTDFAMAALVIPFAVFYFLKDGSKIRRNLLRLVPNKYFESTITLIDKIEHRLNDYFRSVLLQSFIVAVLSWATLSIAGLQNSLSVGITVGVANTIPYFGPIIGYILSMIVSIIETGNFALVLPCVLAILVVQITDNVVLQPLLFSRSADLHPVVILFVILIGAQTAGIFGMLVAIPIATMIKITVNQIIWSFNNYQIFKLEQQNKIHSTHSAAPKLE